MLKKRPYDLILLDLSLARYISEAEEFEGLAIYRWVKNNDLGGKVVIATGLKEALGEAKKIVNDKTDVYIKPLGREGVQEIMKNLS